ncbi:MAG: ATP-binding protein [Candidatus Omnitrophota bacterium]
MKIRQKLILCFLILSFIGGIGGSFGVYHDKEMYDITKEEVYSSIWYLSNIRELMEMVDHQRLYANQYLFSNPGSEEKRKRYLKEMQGREAIFKKYRQNACDHAEPLLKMYHRNVRMYQAKTEEAFALFEQGASRERIIKKMLEADAYAEIAHDEALNPLIKHVNEEHIEPAKKAIEMGIKRSVFVAGSISIIAIILAVGLGIFTAHIIYRPLTSLKNAAAEIGKGNLDTEIQVKSKDEIGQLAYSFKTMAADLKKTTVSKDYMDNIVGSMIDALVVVTPAGKIQTVNKAVCNLLEYKEQQLIEKDMDILFPKEARDKGRMEILLKDGNLKSYETNFKTSDGRYIPVLFSGAVMKDEDGNINSIVCVAKDITELKRAESVIQEKRIELEEANRELEKNEGTLRKMLHDLRETHEDLKNAQRKLVQSEKLASIGQLAAGIAHEINNPIGFINSNLSTFEKYMDSLFKLVRDLDILKPAIEEKDIQKALQIETQLNEFEKEIDVNYIFEDIENLIKESKEGIERIKKIVTELRTFSRKDEEIRVLADLNKVMDGVLNMVWSEMKYKGKLRKFYSDIPKIECNPQQVAQVFINMLINAVQAIKDKGDVSIRTYVKDKNVKIEIEDTGCGIPKDAMEKIFDPFFTTKEIGEGTGLGLSISYDIVKRHNGDIEVMSEVGKGAKFIISFPV